MQKPDNRPGNYYVSAIDGPDIHLLLGPFSRHVDALSRVDAVRSFAVDKGEAKAAFMAFGTVRMPGDCTRQGTANKYLPELLS